MMIFKSKHSNYIDNNKLNKYRNIFKTASLFVISLALTVTSLASFISIPAMAYPGELDTSFNFGGSGFDGAVRKVIVQNDEKIIATGGFSNYNSTPANRIIRLSHEGGIDSSFVYGSGFNATVNEATIQEDGKIVCVGLFTEYNGISSVGIARLNIDGSLDESFSINSGVGFSGGSAVSVTFNNDKILVSGSFISYNGNVSRNLVRINIDGTYDSTLNIGTGFVGTVYDPTVLSDGKILITGNFSALNGSTVSTGILRLNNDGSVDSSFNTGTGFNPNARFIYVDDKVIYYTGSINSYDTTPANRIIRLNSDGTLDNTFVYGAGFDGSTQKLAIDPTSKILVTGSFLNYDTTPANRIIRLNSDGTLDNTFVYGAGFNGNTQYLTIDKSFVYISGSFTSYNNQTAGRLARLYLTNDKDADGLDDNIEDSSPNSGDANQDGTLDSLQNNVTSYINPITNQTTVLQVDSQCSLSNISTKDMSTNTTQDTNYSYPLGLYDFTASCGTPGHSTSFKAYYYSADTTKNYSLRKYNPNTNTYTTIDNTSFNIETIAGIPVLTVSYQITDGSSLDTDGLVNGIIVDPAGPALASTVITNNTNTPTAPNTGVGLSSDSNKQDLIALIIAFITILSLLILSNTKVIINYKLSKLKQNLDD